MRARISMAFTLAIFIAPIAAYGDTGANELRASGVVGEQASGFLAPTPGATLSLDQRRAMDQINIARRDLYAQKAGATGVTAQQFGQITACEIFKRLAQGQSYRDENNVWAKAGASGAPTPSWCPK